jgi:RNA polymerase sigma-70 factor (sigma-E family)
MAGAEAATNTEAEQALAAAFADHYDRLCRLAFLILGDKGRAEESVMEAFLRVFRRWDRLREPERVDAYLCRTVVNLCRSRLRRWAVELRANEASGGARPWERDELRSVVHNEVWEAVRRLPPRQRAAVVLRYYLDLSEREVAETLRCSPGTVKSQLAKARASLGRRLKEEGEGDGGG